MMDKHQERKIKTWDCFVQKTLKCDRSPAEANIYGTCLVRVNIFSKENEIG